MAEEVSFFLTKLHVEAIRARFGGTSRFPSQDARAVGLTARRDERELFPPLNDK